MTTGGHDRAGEGASPQGQTAQRLPHPALQHPGRCHVPPSAGGPSQAWGEASGSLVWEVGGAFLLFLASSTPRPASVLTHSGAPVKSLEPGASVSPGVKQEVETPASLPSAGRAEAQGQGGRRAGPGAPAEGKDTASHCTCLAQTESCQPPLLPDTPSSLATRPPHPEPRAGLCWRRRSWSHRRRIAPLITLEKNPKPI